MGSTAQQGAHLPNDRPWTLGDRLAKARTKARKDGVTYKLSQEALGERLGFSRNTVGRYEADQPVDDHYLARTVRLWGFTTGWSYEWLMHGTGPCYADGTDGPDGAATPSGLPEQGFGCIPAQRRLVVVEAA